jgi:hypothetical protein
MAVGVAAFLNTTRGNVATELQQLVALQPAGKAHLQRTGMVAGVTPLPRHNTQQNHKVQYVMSAASDAASDAAAVDLL